MSKRELEQLTGANEIEGPRTKRRKETAVAASPEVDVIKSDLVVSGSDSAVQEKCASKEVVKELGLKLWQTVRDAVNKEGRTISLAFLRRPSKRQYPDYYQLIQQPIALDEIKKKLENNGYQSLESVKDDFDLCFNNAKQYNMKESTIWDDAKELQKLVSRTYGKMIPTDEDGENAEADGKGKSKGPNLTRLITARLKKLVDKTDQNGRVLSTEFMELPPRKEWPIYYKTIKKPQCLENIFRRIKRKEYFDAREFATDVELVFSNALSFNQEHTLIWEDAKALRDYFRQLMSDMPPPYVLPEYTRPSNGKIKIRPPAASHSIASTSANVPVAASASGAQPAASSPLVLRVPAVTQVKTPAIPTPAPNGVSLPVAKASPTPPTTAPSVTVASTTAIPAAPVPPIPYTNNTFSHYPNTAYTPPVASSTLTSTSNLPVSDLPRAASASGSPVPSQGSILKSVLLTVQSTGRSLHLYNSDGVKCWAMRLLPGEAEVHLGTIVFLDGDEEEESSGEDDGNEAEEKQDEDEEEAEDVPAKTGRKKGRSRGKSRAKTTKATASKANAISPKKKKQKTAIQVTLNGASIKEDNGTGKWAFEPSQGMNVIEVGESGGLLWKIYLQRV